MKNLIATILVWFAIGVALTGLYGNLANDWHYTAWVKNGTPMAIPTSIAIIAIGAACLIRYGMNGKHK